MGTAAAHTPAGVPSWPRRTELSLGMPVKRNPLSTKVARLGVLVRVAAMSIVGQWHGLYLDQLLRLLGCLGLS